jgi:ELWxxDGT repeat protein
MTAKQILFDGIDSSGRQGLWVTDGTAGTREIAVSGASSSGLNPFGFTAVNGKVLFDGTDASGNATLWVTDGTSAGTSEITVAGTAADFLPQGFAVLGNEVLFEGYDASGFQNLWVSDGTAGGTFELTGITGANAALTPSSLTTLGSEVLFGGYDSSGRHGLWVSNGTAAGTSELSVAGLASFAPNGFTVFGSEAAFQAMDSRGNIGLWVTDGTAAGTSEISVAGGNRMGIFPFGFVALGNRVLFDANDTTGQQGLWVTDGTAAGTSLITDVPSGPKNLVAFGNEVLFNANDSAGSAGLWVTDGTAAGTSELAVAGAASGGLDPSNFAVHGSIVLFDGNDASGHRGLWVTNGTAAGTSELSVSGANSGGLDPTNLANVPVVVGPVIDAAATASFTQNGGAVALSPALTVTDGGSPTLASVTVKITAGTFAGDGDVLAANVAGTGITASYDLASETLTLSGTDTLAHYQQVLDSVTFNTLSANPGGYGSHLTRTLLWTANDGVAGDLTGTTTTTIGITAINDAPVLANVAASATFIQYAGATGAVTLSPSLNVSDKDNLDLASATVRITGGTFANDGDVLAATVTGTGITASYNATTETLTLSGSDTLAHYQQVLDSVTFNSTSHQPTDSGAAITRTITWTLNDGGSSNNLSASASTTVNVELDRVLFAAYDAQFNINLWETDGTAAGTSELSVAGARPSGLFPTNFVGLGGKVLFDGYDANGQQNLWVTDGTASGTSELSVAGAGAGGLGPLDFVAFGGKLLFFGYDAGAPGSYAYAGGLWVTDGTAVGTSEVFTLPGGGLYLRDLTVLGSEVLFEGNGNLWVTNGTAAGTSELAVAGAYSGGLNPLGLAVLGSKVLFSGADANAASSFDRGLWVTDGTASGTSEISVAGAATYNSFIRPYGFNPQDFTAVGSKVLFQAVDTADNTGLWVTDGTSAGTSELSVAGAAPGGLDPSSITRFGGKVLFAGRDANSHYNLWVSDGTASGTSELAVTGANAGSFGPFGFTVFGSEVKFFGVNASGAVDLWVTDGTSAGTSELSIAGGSGAPVFNSQSTMIDIVQNPALLPPALSGVPATASLTEASAVTLAPSAAVSDPHSATLTSATVAIVGGTFAGDGDVLATVSTTGTNITASYSSATETLTLSGVDTLAHYQLLLDSVQFSSTSQDPTDHGADPTRTIFWTVNDGGASHNLGSATETVNIVPCYCRGTLIDTKRGQKRVEKLKIGDEIVTMSGALRPIKWIGRRSYGGRFIIGRNDILPVCIKAGALGDKVPARDLWISPHHAMYFKDKNLEGVLIEAKDLVNGVSIVQAEHVDKVEYFHIELDTHDVIIAEGAPSESFIDDDSRGMFHNAHEYRSRYPDAAAGPARYCAPRLDDGYEVEAARQRIALRAGLRTANDAPETGTLRGYVDLVSAERIAGWAQNADHPEAPVCLDIHAGGRLIGQTLANRYRGDLQQAGLGSGCHGFEFAPPAGLNFSPETVEVCRSLDGAPLDFSARARRVLQRIAV